ncbi:UDP-2-acetamido-2,6-beta-L-arabino-hexul-4-ose reductase [Oligella urethralis]|uniref:NAD dependent epimerase/dehydratase, LLPSF_EDH_00030 family n=1 Tax=Oligella urethralis TaxID=90245 RepID=A0A2N6Q9M9_9BURK|nr:capsular polysaccharide biosynthesis protein CapF [Oligella urethralis]PMC15694.1 capsular biosynthesis protein [Oligella urethralis]SPY08741.1 NAD dependent epimerase/dehydratase, LLPSF_EDH_00030 family [Oligella urethralis]
MKVLITGADGFIGKNLQLHLSERKHVEVLCFTRENSEVDLQRMVDAVDFVFHLAGVNRPKDAAEFQEGNTALTKTLCDAIKLTGKSIPVIYSSSIQAVADNPYGLSKRKAEDVLLDFAECANTPVFIYRLANVFGKWARPNYNSAVATFCHNIAQDLPIKINDANALINLVYIDDVIESFLQVMDGQITQSGFIDVIPQYQITVGDLADQIRAFKTSRDSLVTENVGNGLIRALYSTYVSYLKPEQFKYSVPKYGDVRGVFVEMLKTKDAGQISFFTAHPGITRGGHYHHSKTEKFLVIKGKACFRFRQMITGEFYELNTSGEQPEIVETVTGWTHDITNVGDEEMIVMLWANEIFDRERPDTYTNPVCIEP